MAQGQASSAARDVTPPRPATSGSDPASLSRRLRIMPILVTLAVAALGAASAWLLWQGYMGKPWTRDGTVRAYVVTLAPEVSGKVTELAVGDNQYVHQGDVLMAIDPRDYTVAVDLAKAAVDQANADYTNKKVQAERRVALSDLATTREERQTYESTAQIAAATLEQQRANLDKANINLERTTVRSPVNGWVTNLLTRKGDYAATGATALSIVDADSFWIDGYFEETALKQIHDGDAAKIWLLGYREVLPGHVEGVARGIVVSNATPGGSGLATVNPIFTWVRLAQRVPVRIRIDSVPPDLRLVVGMTATIEIEPNMGSGPVAQPVDAPAIPPSGSTAITPAPRPGTSGAPAPNP